MRKTLEELQKHALHNTYMMETRDLVIFRCCECRVQVEKASIPEKWLDNGNNFFYVRWFSLCDECRKNREVEMLKSLPKVITAIINSEISKNNLTEQSKKV